MINPILFAQAQGASPGSGMAWGALLFQFGAIAAIFWFVLIRPQQKERKRHEASLLEIKKGDEITTAGGIIGDVVHIQLQAPKEGGEAVPRMEDRLTIKSGDSRLIVERSRVSRIVSKTS